MKVKIFLPFSKLAKRPQTKFYADEMSDSKVVRSKLPKFIVGSKYLAAQIFSHYRYFIKATTTDIDMFCTFS